MTAGRKSEPIGLKLVKSRRPGTDSGGRPLKYPPKFKRVPPVKPDTLEGPGSRMWDEIVEALGALDVLKSVDGAALQIACETYDRWWAAREQRREQGMLSATSQGMSVAPWVRIEESAGKEFRAWCTEFGLTPSAEMKLAKDVGSDGAEDNPFAGS